MTIPAVGLLKKQTRSKGELFDYSNRLQTVSNPKPRISEVPGTQVFPLIPIVTKGLQTAFSLVGFPGGCHLLLCRAMDYLWTPWRYAYVTGATKTSDCVFCELVKLGDDAKARIVHRGQSCFIILNTFPYTPGHVMIVPYAHLDELRKLPIEAAHEMMELSQRMENVLRELYRPDGFNLGMNIGKAAGAGVAGHIHMHALPRWVADSNFVSVVGETRILPETLDVTYEKIRTALQTPTSS